MKINKNLTIFFFFLTGVCVLMRKFPKSFQCLHNCDVPDVFQYPNFFDLTSFFSVPKLFRLNPNVSCSPNPTTNSKSTLKSLIIVLHFLLFFWIFFCLHGLIRNCPMKPFFIYEHFFLLSYLMPMSVNPLKWRIFWAR